VIPKVIHQIWVGGPMPAHLRGYVETVKAVHPEWEHRLWTDSDFDGWLTNQHLFDAAHDIAPGSEGQLRSDIARYEILERFGGVYLDCDMEAQHPLDGLLDVEAFAAWELDHVWVGNTVLGSVPGSRFVETLVRRLPQSVQRNAGNRPNKMTGPHFVTPIARHTPVAIYPQAWFYPYEWNQLERGAEHFPDALCVHHWENGRKRFNRPRRLSP
jgi:inositol phosphorylceramide mannosyltransferase catalytic subunit